MRQKSGPVKEPSTQVLKSIRRATRRHFSAEDKIRILLEGLRGEDSIAELCRREVSLLKSPQGRERLVIFAGQPYRRGHGVDSLRRCFALRFPFSQPRLAGN